MEKSLRTGISFLRLIGLVEGVSLLILLGIAMPLKYLMGKPELVKIVGWIHGLLFILFMILVLLVYKQRKWPFKKVIIALIAALVPFGTFFFDAQLKKEQNN